MTSTEIRQKFLNFFRERGHVVVPSSPLIPDDPSVLLTTAGMQQFKLYYTGDADPMGTVHPTLGKPLGSKNAVSAQKSFRTSDIDEVGDASHLTFFEMLGNFSFGGYFKKEAIVYAFDFITKEMQLPISYVTIFGGSDPSDAGVPKDEESRKIWNSLGVKDVREEGIEDVFWGPTGSAGPCGPTTEIYCKNKAGEDVEIWNIVFNEFFFPGSREELLAGISGKKLEKLPAPGVDTGMGLERLAMVAQKKSNIFETDLFRPLMEFLPKELPERIKRIFVDHARGSTFLLADGVRPSNKEAGYVLRRLLRRVFVYTDLHKLRPDTVEELMKIVITNYAEPYPQLKEHRNEIINAMWSEYERFQKTLGRGVKEIYKLNSIDAAQAFGLYETFGIPYEIIKELGGEKTKDLMRNDFDVEFKKHQAISRAGLEKKFGGHGLLLDTGELKAGNEEELKKVTRLHTATHMLQQALREVLGPEVHQMGSDITAERTRFDFSFPRKLTPEEIAEVQQIVNQKIKEDLPMQKVTLPKSEAEKTGALYFFKEKYPDPVNVYFVGKDLAHAWSKEFCGGPHVAHTGEIGEFKIVKEEAVGAGVRRIRGVVRP